MNALVHHFLFELHTGVRHKTLLLMNYLFPLGFYLMVGFIMPSINPFFLEVMVPSMVVFAVLASTLLGLPDPMVSSRLAGVFRSYRIYGVPARAILLIPALTNAVHIAITSVIIVISAPILFDAPAPVSWTGFFLTLAVIVWASSGLGSLIGVASANTRIQVIWCQVIFIPSMLLGGLMIPHQMLPAVAGKVALLLPATHAMNSFNAFALGKTPAFNPSVSLVVLLIGGLAAFELAAHLFNWDREPNRRSWLALLIALPYLGSWLW